METPIKPSTDKVPQRYYPLSLVPSNDEEFPLAYADNIWDVVQQGTSLAELTGAIGQFDQHTINELLAALILQLLPQPSTHCDFTDDFTDDFD